MKFSVLISVYKHENPEYFRLALHSILNQGLKPNEVVIVKDGALTVELETVITDFCALYRFTKIIALEQNVGLGRALAIGVKACTYEWIARMDSDDISLNNRFSKQIEYLETHRNCVLLGSWIEEFSTYGDYRSITKLPVSYEDILEFSKKRNPFRHMTVFFKKSAVLSVGNYRHFLWFEDYDLWVRLLQAGFRVANLPVVLVKVRTSSDFFERRGGLAYYKQEIRFQQFLKKINYISCKEFLFNILVRGMVRVVPNKLRTLFYKVFLRS